jgi:transglutaminase-like putative cysteine protease
MLLATSSRGSRRPGNFTVSADFVIADLGFPDGYAPTASKIPVPDLPLPYLLGSRYCETDKLSQLAWNFFGSSWRGWPRVQAVADYVHNHLRFDYQLASETRPAAKSHEAQVGVCRDFAHLAVTFCRCLSMPARYATGYLGDIGVPPDPAPMGFSAWFEIYLNGPEGPRWCIRRQAQSSPCWPHRDGSRPGRDRLRAQHKLRYRSP